MFSRNFFLVRVKFCYFYIVAEYMIITYGNDHNQHKCGGVSVTNFLGFFSFSAIQVNFGIAVEQFFPFLFGFFHGAKQEVIQNHQWNARDEMDENRTKSEKKRILCLFWIFFCFCLSLTRPPSTESGDEVSWTE